MIPRIPPMTPYKSSPDPAPDPNAFTMRDAAAWLGISWDIVEAEWNTGRHGGPIGAALLDARDAQGTATPPVQVLARHGIDPDDPLAAVKAFDKARARFDA